MPVRDVMKNGVKVGEEHYTEPLTGYRTLVTAPEFIGLFEFDEWAQVKKTADTDVEDFVSALETYPKSFDTGHSKVTAGMTAIVQAGDISMTSQRAQDIVKGVLR